VQLVERLLQALASNPPNDLQSLTDAVAATSRNFSQKVIEFAFYSPDVKHEHVLHQICSSSNTLPKTVDSFTTKLFIKPINLTFFRKKILYLIFNHEFIVDETASLLICLEMHCNIILFQKRQKIRHGIAQVSLDKYDENSFVHKITSQIRNTYINCDQVAIFRYIEDLQRVVLSGATHTLTNRKDTFAFAISGSHSSALCIDSAIPLISYGKSVDDFPRYF
jgi:hypothetical protein